MNVYHQAHVPLTHDDETREVGVGPFSFDITMARDLGYTDEEISACIHAMSMLSRGANETKAMREGRSCEECFGRDPVKKYLPCGGCGRS